MAFRKSLILASVLIAGFMPLTARAQDNRQVWRDTEGQIVHVFSSGTCVRENSATSDPCAPSPVSVEVTWTPPVHYTVIAKEDRTVYFEFDKAGLTPEAKAKLDALAEKIKSANDVQGADVAGYADRIGTVSYNEKLSEARAKTVRDYLIAQKVVNTNVTKTRWFGKSEPKANCAKNLPRAQMIQCLQSDRKVQVDIIYRVEPPAHGGQ
ncbi:MAG: OmpA family protein [Alphaproteobacteria bacterium]|nr:OmpA family protein [Alphaproteobacteria bacterium]